jgi:hypothetical protein
MSANLCLFASVAVLLDDEILQPLEDENESLFEDDAQDLKW